MSDPTDLVTCASATRPAMPTPDTIVREIDTGRVLRWTGSEWVDDLWAWLEWAIEDDERVANACQHKVWTCDGGSIFGEHPTDEIVDWVYDEGGWEHIARHDPARVLREVEAKRRIMAIHHPSHYASYASRVCDGCGYGGYCDDPTTEDINECPILRAMVLPYVDRAGRREEWAP